MILPDAGNGDGLNPLRQRPQILHGQDGVWRGELFPEARFLQANGQGFGIGGGIGESGFEEGTKCGGKGVRLAAQEGGDPGEIGNQFRLTAKGEMGAFDAPGDGDGTAGKFRCTGTGKADRQLKDEIGAVAEGGQGAQMPVIPGESAPNSIFIK